MGSAQHPVLSTLPDLSVPLQINGVDMTEARHDHAVSLLTSASPTIALLLERETGGAPPPSPPPHSSSPPTTTAAVTPGEPGLLRLTPSLLTTTLEGPYPVEVRRNLFTGYPHRCTLGS